MSFGWDLVSRAEDFVRRHWKTKAVRDAEKRQRARRQRIAALRARRGLSMGLLPGAGIAGYAIVVEPLAGPTLAVAGGCALLAVAAGAAWPARRNASGILSNEELVQLAADAEEWLLARRPGLPRKALPAADEILVHLGDIQPHLARIDPHASLAWESRRLIGDHLPRFVEAWCDLPTATREEDPVLAERLTDALQTLEDELARLCRDISRSRLVDFEARGRFIETRYKDSESLRSD
jgi:hypothetical protein